MSENGSPYPTYQAGECSSQALLLLAAGELPGDQRPALQEHLAVCPTCRAELETLQAALGDLEGLTIPPMSREAIARTRSAARKVLWPRRQVYVRHGVKRLTRWLTYAAAAMLALGLIWNVLTPRSGQTPIETTETATGGENPADLARQTEQKLLEAAMIGEVLVESYGNDEWSQAADIVMNRHDQQEELIRELLRLEMELQSMEEWE